MSGNDGNLLSLFSITIAVRNNMLSRVITLNYMKIISLLFNMLVSINFNFAILIDWDDDDDIVYLYSGMQKYCGSSELSTINILHLSK